MNDIGWSHCDLKPANLFFNVQKEGGRYNWSTAVCWLIDFGGARKFNQPLYARTHEYSPVNALEHAEECGIPLRTIQDLIRQLNFDPNQEQQFLSEKYNAFSRGMIWKLDMEKLFGPTPRPPLSMDQLWPGMTSAQYLEMRKGLIDQVRAQPIPESNVNLTQQRVVALAPSINMFQKGIGGSRRPPSHRKGKQVRQSCRKGKQVRQSRRNR